MINIQKMSGSYFAEGVVTNYLKPFAEAVEKKVVLESEIELSYDSREDFYHIEFRAGGRNFDIKYYKVFSLSVDGVRGWDCPSYMWLDLVDMIANKAKGK